MTLVFGLAVCTGSRSAQAQAQKAEPGAVTTPNGIAPSEPAGYRALADEGMREYADARYEEARAIFLKAQAIYPNARIHRALGMAEYELRNYGDCIELLQAALASQVRPLEGKLRDETEQLLARAESYVARLVVDAKPMQSRVIIDGVTVEVPDGQAMMLRVGEHTLEVQAAGYLAEKRSLNVKGGELEKLTIVLQKPLVVPKTGGPDESKTRWYKNPWLWTAVGVVVVGASVGSAIALSSDTTTAAAAGGSTGQTLIGP